MNAWRSKYALLARREFWESRALWLAPATVALLFPLLVVMVGNLHVGPGEGIQLSSPQVPPGWSAFFGQMLMLMLTTLLGMVSCITMFVYLLDCLYAERKDRSILFWKSLPVSDSETVLAKLGVALVLLPLLTLLLALAAVLLLIGLALLRFELFRAAFDLHLIAGIFKVLPQLLVFWMYCVLWYLPVVAYLLLASVLAKRAPLMYALLPPLVLMLVEWMIFNSARVARFLGERLAPWARWDWAWGQDIEGEFPRGAAPRGIGSPDWAAIFSNLDLWLGLAAGAVMVYIVIRLRRYRDDT